jgi:HEAT repeat protein
MSDMHSTLQGNNPGDVPHTGDLVSYLTRAVAAYEDWAHRLVAPASAPPDRPYRSLYAFDVEDADLFFGRAAATRALYQTVLSDRLTVMHAKSAAGKTSLLNAGLSPHLIREGRLPVYVRAYDDPVATIKRAIVQSLAGPEPDVLSKLTLYQFLSLVCSRFSRQTRELVIILDQFEQFFIFWPERSHRRSFVAALAECYDDKSLPVRMVIAIRKEYYSDLAEFQGRIPNVLTNEYWLGPMTQEQAYMAIVGPVAKLSRPLTVEPALLDVLVADLTRGASRQDFGEALTLIPEQRLGEPERGIEDGDQSVLEGPAEGVEPLRLQLICAQLYEMSEPDVVPEDGEAAITLASYQRLDPAAGEVGPYLQGALHRLPDHQQPVAQELLQELVGAGGTRRILSGKSLKARTRENEPQLDEILCSLVDAWILRCQEISGEMVYEIAHDCLVSEIQDWLDPEELAFKRVQHLLRREVVIWRSRGTLIPGERLELLHAHLDGLSGFDLETRQFLLCSSLAAGSAVEDWAALAGDGGEGLLLASRNDRRNQVRRAVTRSLGVIWGLPQVSELGDEDQETRQLAADALGGSGDARAVGPLVTALQDNNSGVRQASAWSLGRLGDFRALGPLIAVLGDDEPDVRAAAATSLGELGDSRTVEPLIIALRDPVPSVRWAVIRGLGALWYLPELIRLGDPDRYVRWAAVRELGKLGNARAVAPLVAILRDEHGGVRRAAAAALVELGECAVPPLIITLRDEDWDLRWAAAWAMGRIGHPRAVEPLIFSLRDSHPDVRQMAAESLTKLGEFAVEPLMLALQDLDPDVRRRSAWVLGELGQPRAGEPLIIALGDENDDVCQASTEALAKLGRPVVGPLTLALSNGNRQTRLLGANALGEIGDPRAVDPLIEVLEDDDSQVRQAAISALQKIGDRQAVEPCIALLGDGDRYVRREAAWALGELGGPRAVEPLIASLHDEDRGVRQTAANALAKLGAPAVEPLGAALQAADTEMRWATITVLGEIGDPRASEPLIAILQDGDRAVRRAVTAALGKIGDARALWPLIGLLQDKDSSVRWAATGALGQLGDPRAIQPLVAALKDEDSSVRRGAADALKIIGPPQTPDSPAKH